MIKISKKYLTKIIKEETAKVFEAHDEGDPSLTHSGEDYTGHKGNISKTHPGKDYMSDEDLMDSSKECPQGWKDADCMVNKINDLVTSNLKSILGSAGELYGSIGTEHQEKIVSDLISALEEPLLDMALEGVPDDDQGEGDELNMAGRFDKKGRRNFGSGGDDSDLMEKEKKDKNWIQGAEKDIEKRGTEGVCTGDKFGSESCPPGSKRYNLAKTFKKMAKDRKKK